MSVVFVRKTDISCKPYRYNTLLHAPFWHLSLRSTVGESLLLAPCRNVSRQKVVGKFPLHATCCNQSVSSFVRSGVSLTRPVLSYFSSLNGSGVSHTHLLSCRSSAEEYLLHAPCWNMSGRRSGGNRASLLTPRARICLVVRRVGSFSYTPHAGIYFIVWRVGNLSYTPRA